MIPLPMQITSSTYPCVFYFFFFGAPFLGPLLAELDAMDRGGGAGATTNDWIIASLFTAAFIASFVFIQWRCSSWAISYWRAIGVKSASAESGCVNITVFYVLPMLLIFHIVFFVIALLSLFIGRGRAQVVTLKVAELDLDPHYPYKRVRQLLLAGDVPGPDTVLTDDQIEAEQKTKPTLSRRAGAWLRGKTKRDSD